MILTIIFNFPIWSPKTKIKWHTFDHSHIAFNFQPHNPSSSNPSTTKLDFDLTSIFISHQNQMSQFLVYVIDFSAFDHHHIFIEHTHLWTKSYTNFCDHSSNNLLSKIYNQNWYRSQPLEIKFLLSTILKSIHHNLSIIKNQYIQLTTSNFCYQSFWKPICHQKSTIQH